MSTDPTKRFSDRVADYVRYRPRYPAAVLEVMRTEMRLAPGNTVVDVGSGTGFLSELFLEHGYRVFGVEPNVEMRRAGEELLVGWSAFTSVAGAAEATTLDVQTADFVVAGQAFHWFRPVETRREFERILRPGGWVVLVWNDRKEQATGVYAVYEKIIRDYRTDAAADKRVLFSNDSAELAAFFAPRQFCHRVVGGIAQEFDFPGLLGRMLSSSYAPRPDHPRYAEMAAALQNLFAEYQHGGKVRFEHQTEIYFGQLGN